MAQSSGDSAPSGSNKSTAPATSVAQKGRAKAPPVIVIPGLHFSRDLPTNFPLPPYPNNVLKTNFSNSTKGRPTAAAVIITKDPADTVFKWYQDYFKRENWAIKTLSDKAMEKMGKQGQLFMLDAEKGREEIHLFCIKNAKKPETTVSISWSLNKSNGDQ